MNELSPVDIDNRRKALYALSKHPAFTVLIEELQMPLNNYACGLPKKDEDRTQFQSFNYAQCYTQEIIAHLQFEISEGERLARLEEGETDYGEQTGPVEHRRPRV